MNPLKSFWLLILLMALQSHFMIASCNLHKPIQLARPANNHTQLEVIPENLKRLEQIEEPVAIIAVVGPYHSG
jgi:hypothetical protein